MDALDFRLSYKQGRDYTELMPVGNTNNMAGGEKLTRQTEVIVEVPPANDPMQILEANLTQAQLKAPFWVELNSVRNARTLEDYNTITQVVTDNGQLVIIRLGDMPVAPIELKLTFEERKG